MNKKLKHRLNYSVQIKDKHTETIYEDRISWRDINIADSLIKDITSNDKDYNFFLTLATNRRKVNLIHLENDLLQFRNQLCSKCFRAKKYINTETGGIDYKKLFHGYAFIERTKSGTPHYHIIGYIHPDKLDKILDTDTGLLDKLWKKQFKSGDINIQKITKLEGVTTQTSISN